MISGQLEDKITMAKERTLILEPSIPLDVRIYYYIYIIY